MTFQFKKKDIQAVELIESILDERDSTLYSVIKVDSLYWFNEDLNFETLHSTRITSSISSGIQGRLYSYEDSKMACPKGWRLPTVREFDALISKIIDTSFTGSTVLPYGWKEVNNNSLGYNFTKTGFLHKKKLLSKESHDIWLEDQSDRVSINSHSYHVHMYDTNRKNPQNSLTVFRHIHTKFKPKKNRKFAIRCVCKSKFL